jgi:hypothetical protein
MARTNCFGNYRTEFDFCVIHALVIGNETITCLAGDFNTLYTSSSNPRISEAVRKRDIIASNGFSVLRRGAGSR